ncbi:biotin--[acetyl-CoA-carboxylase] ligase [Candidatus Woesearchaeota archaeon]|nr:biotin--[acetyl-CoA-carboxylase] ligase [Candidatus Woesearchaeota archaeon]
MGQGRKAGSRVPGIMHIHNIRKTDSTNRLARKYKPGTVIRSAIQSSGVGRFGRKWVSDSGGLWFSIVLKPERKLCEYTFIASLAVLDAIGKKAEIKWPNDLVYKGEKLCGILTEIHSSGNTVKKVIVGIGLNVNNDAPSGGVSLKEIMGHEINIDELLRKIVENFIKISKLSISSIIAMYRKKCSMLGKMVTASTLEGTFYGKAAGIDDEGNLILETNKGVKKLTEGDATLGYSLPHQAH